MSDTNLSKIPNHSESYITVVKLVYIWKKSLTN